MKKTPWFSSRIKPVRNGLYEIKSKYGRGFAYWTGEYWRVPDSNILFNWYVQLSAKWRGVFK